MARLLGIIEPGDLPVYISMALVECETGDECCLCLAPASGKIVRFVDPEPVVLWQEDDWEIVKKLQAASDLLFKDHDRCGIHDDMLCAFVRVLVLCSTPADVTASFNELLSQAGNQRRLGL